MARILVVRHAQSEWNAMGRWQGWADPPLSPLGRSQAEQAGRHLLAAGPPIALVTSSDLRRAAQTAAILAGSGAPSAAISADPGWREYRVGAWSGLTRDEIAQQWPGALIRWDRGDLSAPPGGETREVFEARLLEALDNTAAATSEGQLTLVISHGGAIRTLHAAFGTERGRRAGGRSGEAPVGRIGNLAGIDIEGAAGTYRRRGAVDLLHEGEGRPGHRSPLPSRAWRSR